MESVTYANSQRTSMNLFVPFVLFVVKKFCLLHYSIFLTE